MAADTIATVLTISLVYSGKLTDLEVAALKTVILELAFDPSDTMSWLAEHVADNPLWQFTVQLNEVDMSEKDLSATE